MRRIARHGLWMVMLAAPAIAYASDWPNWRGPQQSGVSQEEGWSPRFGEDGPRVLWEKEIGIGYSAASVKDGRVYIAGWRDGQDTLHCLDAATGQTVWTHRSPMKRYNNMHEGGPGSTPAVGNGRVFLLSREADLICLDSQTGQLNWRKSLMRDFGVSQPRWAFTGSPTIDGETLFIDVGVIAAFDAATGDLRWRTKDYGPAYSTPVPFTLDGRRLLACFPEYGLVILDAQTGREVASHRWKTSYGVNATTPIVRGNRFFVSTGYNTGAAALELTPQGLKVLWESREMRNKLATSVLIDGYLYGFDESQLKCVDFATGRRMWAQRGLGLGSLIAADGKLIILSENGQLVIAQATPQRFSEISRARVLNSGKNWVMPVLADGRIYCRSAKGQLVCLDVSR